MPKQYTFRTTRETSWLDEILMGVSDKDRARFIRNTLMAGLNGSTIELQSTHEPNTNSTQTEDKPNTETLARIENTEEPLFGEPTELDLESKLNNLDF